MTEIFGVFSVPDFSILQPGLFHYLVLSALMFAFGLYGMASRRGFMGAIISAELLLNAANINFAAFNRYLYGGSLTGRTFAVFIIAVAAAEAAIGIAAAVSLFSSSEKSDFDEVKEIKG